MHRILIGSIIYDAEISELILGFSNMSVRLAIKLGHPDLARPI